MSPAIPAPRARALAAGPAPSPPRPSAPGGGTSNGGTSNGGTSNGGTSNGSAYAPPPPPPPPRSEQAPPPPPGQPAASRSEILQWFEDAFDELRNELHAVVSAVTRQQAMLAELLDSREAELRVVMVAETLPELAGEAASRALSDQSDGLAEIVAGALDDFRSTMEAADLSNAAVMDSMRELLRRVEVTAELNTEAAREEGGARLQSLKASVGRQLKPLAAAVAEVAEYIEIADEREAARAKALKASVARQMQPLAAELAEIRARLDALSAPKAPRAAKKPASRQASTRQASTTKPTPAAKPRVAAKKRPAPTPASPESEVTVLYDYEAPPTASPNQPPPLLLRRRQAKS